MIAYNSYVADGFVYMPFFVGPHEHGHPMLNANDGFYSQFIYVVHGSGSYHIRDTEDGDETGTALPAVGQLLNISENYEKFHCIEAGENGAGLVFFNPIPATQDLAIELLESGSSHTVTATDKNKTVVCISGPISIGGGDIGKSLVAHQHAKVKPGQSFTVSIPDHSVAVIVTVA